MALRLFLDSSYRGFLNIDTHGPLYLARGRKFIPVKSVVSLYRAGNLQVLFPNIF